MAIAFRSGYGDPLSKGKGGLYRWRRGKDKAFDENIFVNFDTDDLKNKKIDIQDLKVNSCAVNPVNSNEMYVTTEDSGLWHTSNLNDAKPIFRKLDKYPFHFPMRVFFNSYDYSEVWVASFGNGLRRGKSKTKPSEQLNKVENIKAEALSHRCIELKWDYDKKYKIEESFIVEYKAKNATDWEKAGEVEVDRRKSGGEYRIDILTPDTEYDFQIYSYHKDDLKSPLVSTSLKTKKKPSNPFSVRFGLLSIGGVRIEWEDKTAFGHLKDLAELDISIYRREESSGDWGEAITKLDYNKKEYIDHILSKPQKYEYRVNVSYKESIIDSFEFVVELKKISDKSLILAMPFDAIYGSEVRDFSIYRNDGNIKKNGTVKIYGTREAIDLDKDGMVEISGRNRAFADIQEFTMEAWVKVKAHQGEGSVLYKEQSGAYALYSNRWSQRMDAFGTGVGLQFYKKPAKQQCGGDINSDTEFLVLDKLISPGQWYHIAGTYNKKTHRLHTYINGKKLVHIDCSLEGEHITSDFPIVIGKNFKGAIDEIRLYNTARSANQIKEDMCTSITGEKISHPACPTP